MEQRRRESFFKLVPASTLRRLHIGCWRLSTRPPPQEYRLPSFSSTRRTPRSRRRTTSRDGSFTRSAARTQHALLETGIFDVQNLGERTPNPAAAACVSCPSNIEARKMATSCLERHSIIPNSTHCCWVRDTQATFANMRSLCRT